MKKILSLAAVGVLALSLAACGGSSSSSSSTSAGSASSASASSVSTASASTSADAEQIELYVSAAASMTETLTEIEAVYEEANPGIDLIFTFDSSGTLKTQIEEGADCDIFISAAPKQMNQLDISMDEEKNPDRLDFVLQGTRIDLLENKVVLCLATNTDKTIGSFDDLAALLKDGEVMLAMGNADVPVGQYTQKIFAYYELNEEDLVAAGKITYGSNVKEVTTQVTEGTVDCGIVYATDAFSAGLEPVDSATAEMCGQVIYPAAVMNTTAHEAEAKAFLEYLTGEEASAIFEAVGFTPLSGN